MANIEVLLGLLPLLLKGALTALEIALCSLLLASAGGVVLAVVLTFSRSRRMNG